jgi:hypothetical protein
VIVTLSVLFSLLLVAGIFAFKWVVLYHSIICYHILWVLSMKLVLNLEISRLFSLKRNKSLNMCFIAEKYQ